MTGAPVPAHAEIISFAARTLHGALSESERADLAALVMLLGGGMRTRAVVCARHRGDQPRQDEFAVCMWQLAEDLFAATFAEAKR